MAPFLMFVLEMQFEGVRTKAVLNGIQISARASGKSGMSQKNLNPWIIEGRNKIQVFAAAVEGGRGAPRLGLKLLGGRQGELPPALAETQWDAAKKPLAASGYTLVWEHEFTPERGFGRWAWQDAPASSLGAEDRAGITALVQEVHSALEKGDAKRLAGLFKLRTAEMARALDMTEAEMSEGIDGMFEEFAHARNRKVGPLNAEGFVMTPQAGGRLIRVTAAEGGAPVKASGEDIELELEMVVSRVGGRWTIVR
jgi:hypothetical protein